jgi:hypothetical protein
MTELSIEKMEMVSGGGTPSGLKLPVGHFQLPMDS